MGGLKIEGPLYPANIRSVSAVKIQNTCILPPIHVTFCPVIPGINQEILDSILMPTHKSQNKDHYNVALIENLIQIISLSCDNGKDPECGPEWSSFSFDNDKDPEWPSFSCDNGKDPE